MAELSKRNSTSGNRPLSADFEPPPREPSILYSMLPSLVQSRISRLPSLRRSVSMYGFATKHKSTDSRPSSGSRTPEMGYTSAMVLSGARGGVGEIDMTDYLTERLSASSEEDLPWTNKRKERQVQGLELTEIKSGINWKFANQGLNLLGLAVKESSMISEDPNFGNAKFARQVYLHAIAYLLRALPSDLTIEEQFSIRGALPQDIIEPLRFDLNSEFTTRASPSSPNIKSSLLHRTLASTIIQLFILFQFILPYLKCLLSRVYQYDREHKISEKLLSQGIETVDTLGKTGLGFTAALYEIGDGKVGQLITDTAAWFVEGVTGGIHEGIGEGMVIMGALPRRGQETSH